jgi:hypothetical protein
MKELIRHIIKESTNNPKHDKLLEMFERLGMFFTVKMVGGIDQFNNMWPEFFESSDNKVELIEDIQKNDGEFIYFFEITPNGEDILYDSTIDDDGRKINTYLTCIEDDGDVCIDIFEITDDEESFNEHIDRWTRPMRRLPIHTIDKIFKIVTDYYL